MINIKQYFLDAIEKKASDLFLVSNERPAMKKEGSFIFFGDEIIDSISLQNFVMSSLALSDRVKQDITNGVEKDIIYEIGEDRFRINIHLNLGKFALSIRVISQSIPAPEFLNFHPSIYKIAEIKDGLILFAGSTGSGKSSVMASLINLINSNNDRHIVTIEDPVEFIIKSKKSLVEQRQIGQDSPNLLQSILSAFRQDPDVLMIGELRTSAEIAAALTAAQTGHLVLSTIHAPTAVDIVERVINSFPLDQQKLVLSQMAFCLRGIFARRLFSRLDNGPRIAAWDIMLNTPGVANLIRENRLANINSLMQMGSQEGMVTFDQSVRELKEREIIA